MRRLPIESLNSRMARFAPYFKIVRPNGKGPFPCVFMVHGCGRADVPQTPYAEALKEKGFVSIIIDSFAPRHISDVEARMTVCTGIQLHANERVGDLAAAMEWSKQFDFIDQSDLHAIGWSHGGWCLMDAVAIAAEIPRHARIDFDWLPMLGTLKSLFCIYPWCGIGSYTYTKGWKHNIPTHVIVCGRDMVTGDALAKRAVEKLRRDGIEIDITSFPTATHSFDETESVHPTHQYSQAYLHQAIDLVCGHFESHRKPVKKSKIKKFIDENLFGS